MIISSVIFGVAYLLIAIGKFPNTVIVVLAAALLVMLLVPLGVIDSGEVLFAHVDLNVILLLAGMMIMADVIARTGAFDWIAIRGVRLVNGSGFGVLCLLAVVTAVVSALIDNVTTVVLMLPITLSLCRTLALNPTPFLLGEVFASNIGGTATVIGDPPNIIVASAADINFLTFIFNIAPISALCMVLLIGLMYLWFRRDVLVSAEKRNEVLQMSESDTIKDPKLLRKSLAVFVLTIAGFLVHNLIGVEVAFIALAGAGVLVLVSGLETREVLHGVEWTTLGFFVGLFILVGGLVETGVIDKVKDWIVDLSGGNEGYLAMVLVWGGGAASGIVDNIPYVAAMTEVVKGIAPPGEGSGVSPLWWALLLGGDLGGNSTMIGASANVVVVNMARAAGHPISFVQFLKYGVVVAASTLLVSAAFLWLRFYL